MLRMGEHFALCQQANQRKQGFLGFFFNLRKIFHSLLSNIPSPKINVGQFNIYCYPPEAGSHSVLGSMCPLFSIVFLLSKSMCTITRQIKLPMIIYFLRIVVKHT